jgi:hypothetical protein
MRSDDLVPLLTTPAAGPGVGFRQGVIVTWDQASAENTVLVGRSLLTNLPILNTSEAAILQAGDVVGILTAGQTFGILGRFTIPGTPEAVSALSALRTASDSVSTSETTSSVAFTDLATPGPEVEIVVGATGRVLVTLSASMDFEALRGFGLNSAGAMMSFTMSGANTLIAFQSRAVRGRIEYSSGQAGGFDTDLTGILDASKVVLLEGLNPGLTTFTAKYAIHGADGPATFANRVISVQAI